MAIRINNTHLIHTVLGHSYMVFVFLFCISILLDYVFPLPFNLPILEPIGITLVILGTILIYWAQHSGHRSMNARYEGTRTIKAFMFGPYADIRTPTQTSLFFLVLGLGFVVNMIWVVICAFLAFLVTYMFFIKKQERILIKRYGSAYEAYKQKVRF